MTTTNTEDAKPADKPAASAVRVLRAGTCPSLSGKSTLTYELGYDDKAALQLRIAKNSGKGMFSSAWVPWDGVWELLVGAGDEPLTSHTLNPLYRGTSANSPGFLWAALRHEGLVQPLDGKARGYRRRDPKAFLGQARALMGNGAAGSARKGPVRALPRQTSGSNGAAGETQARATATISPAASQVGLPNTNGSGKKADGSKADLAGDVVRLLATGNASATRPGSGTPGKKPPQPSRVSVRAKSAVPKAAKAVKPVKPVPVKKGASAGRR
jgi:hypothetical protein